MSEKKLRHNWEKAVGRPGYRFKFCQSLPSKGLAEANPTAYQNGMREAAQVAKSLGIAFGSCYVCGMGLMHNMVCQNADGKHFVVGSECVKHLGDTRLTTDVEEAKRNREKAARRKRDAARREKARLEWMETQREENAKAGFGRITNGERMLIENRRREEEAKKKAKAARKANEWLIEVLWRKNGCGGFVESMLRELDRRPIRDLSPRQIEVLGDIYAKATGGRRGSKAYNAARDEFDAKADWQDDD